MWLLGCSRPQSAQQESKPASLNDTKAEEIGAAPGSAIPLSVALATVKPNPALQAKLRAALAAKPKNYNARTKHKSENGRPKYTNRLIFENSPYLLQHAHNPVNWFSWGPEALALAKALNRPIFLSIGYSTCHWCHVMEEESFEDEEIASYINENYIPIKVDREERPDLDSVYMTAVQLLTGRGGWPMSVWLTPKLEPFFGGTYFPARDGDRGSRVGFLSLMNQQATAFRSDPANVATRAKELTRKVQQRMHPQDASGGVTPQALVELFAGARRRNDPVHGGPRGAPKFPSSFPFSVLLRLGSNAGFIGARAATVEKEALSMTLNGLTKMARGGIYDHIGGGFHRYSVDAKWLVPHFEKMLYDNAQLALLYTEAYQVSGQPQFRRVALETLDYVAREMTAPNGGFYSATDADSLTPKGHREEGYFFTWTLAELQSPLTREEFKLTEELYSPSRRGNFEGRNILFQETSLEDYAKAHQQPAPQVQRSLERIKQKLREARKARAAPLLDDKIQTSWNGLMLAAFARASAVFSKPQYQAIAEKNAQFFLNAHQAHGRVRHSERHGQWSNGAFLDDYSFYANGLLELFEASQKPRYLAAAATLMEELEKWHSDPVHGGYFMTASDQQKLLVREKPDYDKAIPSGNSYALLAQLKLQQLTLDDRWRARAEMTVRAFSRQLSQNPQSLSEMLRGVYFQLSGPKQVLLALPSDVKDNALENLLRSEFIPNAVMVVSRNGQPPDGAANLLPWIKGKKPLSAKPTAYVCEQGSCQRPTTQTSVLRAQLRGSGPTGPATVPN